ncbi:cyclase [Micromonospora craterilacus]|uniref:Cyclase n=1 Tax=Micromonospora craterilacus TaxID=1655439 RepID=A0A2W2DVP9_9ACTN|nr:SRPBCC family protein [Micromonospora craterilacus]PZG14261.1 cyclase [Micromonospora craterilacus]
MSRRSTTGVRSVTDSLGIERASQTTGVDGVARFLGWLSLGLGVASLGAGPRASRLCGVDDSRAARTVLRIAGLRELGHAATLLIPRRAGWGAWTRVAGDAVDLTALAVALRSRRGPRRRRLVLATSAVAGLTAMDLYAALRATGRPRMPAAERITASVTVNRSVEDTYRYWHDFYNLPRFMYHLQSVRRSGDGRTRWAAKAPAGRTVEWEAEIVADRPNQLIAWQSVDGSPVPNSGRVEFRRAAGGRGTEVRVELEVTPPGRKVGALVARAFGEDPQQQVRDDLRRFKQVIETGEITRSDGSPDGISVQQQLRQRPGRPPATRVEWPVASR